MRLNEMKLNDSFKQAKNVILIFSVKESGRFQGIARLRQNSQKDYSPYPNWLLPPGMSRHVLGGVFKIDWLCKHDLSFSHAMSLRNIWNQNKPIKIGRDGQEIEPQAANQLCSLFPHDEDVDVEHILQISKRFRRQYNEFIPHQPKTLQNFNRRQNSGIRNHFRNRTAPAYTSSGQPARSPLRTDNYQLNSTVSMVSSSQNRQSNGIKKLPSQVSMTHKFRNTTHQSDYSSSRYKLGGLGKSHEDACDEFVRKAKVERSYKSTSSRSSRRSRSKQYSSSSDERYYSDKEESVSPEPPRRKEFKKEKRRGIAMMTMMIIDIMTMERDRESTKKVLKMIIITGGRIIVGHVAIVVKKSFTIPVGIAVIPETAIMTTIKGRRITDIKTSGLTKSRGHVTNMSGLNLMTVITSTPNTMSDIKIIEAPSMMQNIENQEDLASTIIANNSNP